ncbi:MAG: MarC family protein [Kofleriaceae bacterium]
MIGEPSSFSLVPMAVPVLVGPATLAIVLVVAEDHGRVPALVAIAANAALNALILLMADRVYARLGPGFGRALGKVLSLILAAMAVAMIRVGLLGAGVGGGS